MVQHPVAWVLFAFIAGSAADCYPVHTLTDTGERGQLQAIVTCGLRIGCGRSVGAQSARISLKSASPASAEISEQDESTRNDGKDPHDQG